MKQIKTNPLLRMADHARPIGAYLVLAGGMHILTVLCAVAAPELLGQLVQTLWDYWNAGETGRVLPRLLPGLGALLGVYCAHSLLSYLTMYLMNTVVTRHFTSGLRKRISDKLRRLPVSYVDQTPVGDVLNRMTDDVSTMGGYIHQIFDVVIQGVFQLVLIAVLLLRENVRLALFVLVLTPLSLLLSAKIAGRSEEYYDRMFEQSGRLTEVVEEAFSGFATVKAYNLEEYMARKHEAVSREQCRITVRANFIGSVVQPIIRLTNAVAYILINLIGGWLIVRQGVSVGVVVTVVLYARQFASPLEQLAYGFNQINYVKAAAGRVFALLDREEETDAPGRELPQVRGQVEFRHVSFAYDPAQPLIRDLNFTVRPGQKVAIVGPTSAGKTTVVNLIMRFYDPDSGAILLDGQDISALSREQVRRQFGMVLQDTWLFPGTIRENVAYGRPDAGAEEVEEACRRAHCDHFIRTLPQGYDTLISEDSATLSGGQKQLLTIARALLCARPLLILDEATSNVDTRTEVLLQQAMDELMRGRTSFVIAHRLSTIVDADLILVLRQGQVVEQGTHWQLLEQGGFYRQLYTSQYALEEDCPAP